MTTLWEQTRNTIQDNPETYEELAPVVQIAVIRGGKFYRTDKEEDNGKG
jgi:hypothetical protein